MYSLILAVLMPCQEVKLDRALFYLVANDKKVEAAVKLAEPAKEQPQNTYTGKSRYYFRSSNC